MRENHQIPPVAPWNTSFPAPWKQVLEKAVERYSNVRCEHWREDLVVVRDGLPMPVPYLDPVLDGFARKTAQRLRHICSCCGKPAKPRAVFGGWEVKCPACWGKSQLSEQIQKLLDEAHGVNLTPFDGKPALWHEQEMPVLLRSAIPSFCWRKLSLPAGGTLRYLAREDVIELAAWLREVQLAMGSSSPANDANAGA